MPPQGFWGSWGAAGVGVTGTALGVGAMGLASQPRAEAPSTAASASLSSEGRTLTFPFHMPSIFLSMALSIGFMSMSPLLARPPKRMKACGAENTVKSATLLAAGDYVTCRELPAEVTAPSTGAAAGNTTVPSFSLRDPASEEEQIRRALAAAGGNKSQAAKLLGVDRKTLYNKLHHYGIE